MKSAQFAKRVIDLFLAGVILLATLPLLLVVSVLILLLEGRPIFYVSRRYVAPGRTIPVIKFRSMVRDAASPKYRLAERFMRDGYLDIPRDCEVYTPIGRFLERFQIVELPQMWNVIWNGMSLIGNRPLPGDNLRLLGQFEGWTRRFDSPAGISGITQVVGKLGLQPPERLGLEIAYSELYRSGNIVRCDLLVFYYTLRFILFSKGISLEKAFKVMEVEAVPQLPVPVPERSQGTAV
jgi:lipopolysaccharide/colanic/teichoic acid biosynthesis glycosyltransferase